MSIGSFVKMRLNPGTLTGLPIALAFGTPSLILALLYIFRGQNV